MLNIDNLSKKESAIFKKGISTLIRDNPEYEGKEHHLIPEPHCALPLDLAKLPVHPACSLYPRGTQEHWEGLRASLEEFQLQDVVLGLYEDTLHVIDGKGRIELLLEMGRRPRYVILPESTSEQTLVNMAIDANTVLKDLSLAFKACIEVKLLQGGRRPYSKRNVNDVNNSDSPNVNVRKDSDSPNVTQCNNSDFNESSYTVRISEARRVWKHNPQLIDQCIDESNPMTLRRALAIVTGKKEQEVTVESLQQQLQEHQEMLALSQDATRRAQGTIVRMEKEKQEAVARAKEVRTVMQREQELHEQALDEQRKHGTNPAEKDDGIPVTQNEYVALKYIRDQVCSEEFIAAYQAMYARYMEMSEYFEEQEGKKAVMRLVHGA